MTKRIGCGVRYRHLKKPKASKATDGYKRRNKILPSVGYSTYREYLKSDDWKAIRGRVLEANPDCKLCKSPSQVVHHYCYFYAVLLGLADELLIALCHNCHESIEFNGDQKRTLRESQNYLLQRMLEVGERAARKKLKKDYHAVMANHFKACKRKSRKAGVAASQVP